MSKCKKLSGKGSATTPTLSSSDLSSGLMLALEPRFMYDAAGLVTGIEGADAANSVDSINTPESNDGQTSHNEVLSLFNSFVPVEQRATTELIFIDSAVEDQNALLQNIASANAEVITLNANRDGVEQISEALSNYENLTSVHIVSHGDVGSVTIGNTQLSLETLDQHKTQLEGWSDSLTTEADILLYGCKVADSDEGASFIEGIGALTGADIAASDDLTGSAELGGDWVLEANTGTIESDIAFTDDGVNDFDALLLAPDIVNNGLIVAEGGSAIIEPPALDINDPEGGELAFTLDEAPLNGQLTILFEDGTFIDLNTNGSFDETSPQFTEQLWDVVYTHNGSTTTQDSFTVTATDTEGLSSTTTLNINIINTANSAPIINNDTVTIPEDAVNFSLTGSITTPSDIDGHFLTITVDSLPSSSLGVIAISVNDGDDGLDIGTPIFIGQTLTSSEVQSLQFDAAPNANDANAVSSAEDTIFSYTVSDGATSTTSTLDITVSPVSDLPVAVDDPIGNSGFEGGLTKWETIGNVTIENSSFGINPTEGTNHIFLRTGIDDGSTEEEGGEDTGSTISTPLIEAFLGLIPGNLDALGYGTATDGSAIKQTITVNAGDTLSFDWNFLTQEGTPDEIYNDFAFIVLENISGLADTNSSFTESASIFGGGETGYDTFSHTFTVGGTYILGIGVTDVEDYVADSGLLVDNILLTSSRYATDDNTALTVNQANGVLANDYDGDGDTLTVTGFDSVSSMGAAVTVNADGSFTYDPTSSATLNAITTPTTDTFTYTVSDGNGGTDTATVTILVNDVDEAPINNYQTSIDENSSAGTSVGTVVTTDPNVGDNLTYSITEGNINNAFAVDANTGVVTVNNTSALDFETNPVFDLTFQIEDGDTLYNPLTLTINLNDLNEAPTITSNTVTDATQGARYLSRVTATDPEGDALTFSLDAEAESKGMEIFTVDNTGFIRWTTPANADIGPLTITIRVTENGDENEPLSTTKSFDLTVAEANERPTNIDLNNLIAGENAANGTVIGQFTTTDPNLVDTHSYSIQDDTSGGAFEIGGTNNDELVVVNGNLLNFGNGYSHQITIRATDADGLTYDRTFTIEVTDVNEAPINIDLDNLRTAENAANDTVIGQLTTTDPDIDDTHSYSIQDDASGGAFGIGGTNNDELIVVNGSLLNFENDDSHQITIRATDADGLTYDRTFTIEVTDVNEAPIINSNNPIPVDEGGSVIISNGTYVDFSDPDLGDSTAVIIDTLPTNGTLELVLDGITVREIVAGDNSLAIDNNLDNTNWDLVYVHNGSETIIDNFNFTITDENGLSISDTVLFSITPVNDNAPIANTGSVTVDEGGTVPIRVLDNVTDADLPGDNLTPILDREPLYGSLTLNPDGTFSYTHDDSENFSDNFTYYINDGINNSDLITVAINITPVNDNTVIPITTVQAPTRTEPVTQPIQQPENNTQNITLDNFNEPGISTNEPTLDGPETEDLTDPLEELDPTDVLESPAAGEEVAEEAPQDVYTEPQPTEAANDPQMDPENLAALDPGLQSNPSFSDQINKTSAVSAAERNEIIEILKKTSNLVNCQ